MAQQQGARAWRADAAVHCVIAGSGVARRRVRAPHAQRAPRAAQAQPGLAAPGAGGVHSAVFQADAAFKLELGAQAAAQIFAAAQADAAVRGAVHVPFLTSGAGEIDVQASIQRDAVLSLRHGGREKAGGQQGQGQAARARIEGFLHQ